MTYDFATSALAEQVVQVTEEVTIADVCINLWVLGYTDSDGWRFHCSKHDRLIAFGNHCETCTLPPETVTALPQHIARSLLAAGLATQMKLRRPDGSLCDPHSDWCYHQFAETANWPGREIHREISDWLYSLC